MTTYYHLHSYVPPGNQPLFHLLLKVLYCLVIPFHSAYFAAFEEVRFFICDKLLK